jgi:hypothetical protein
MLLLCALTRPRVCLEVAQLSLRGACFCLAAHRVSLCTQSPPFASTPSSLEHWRLSGMIMHDADNAFRNWALQHAPQGQQCLAEGVAGMLEHAYSRHQHVLPGADASRLAQVESSQLASTTGASYSTSPAAHATTGEA